MVPTYSTSQEICSRFCFAVLCCGYTLTDFPISIRLTSLPLWQSNDCPSASKATLVNMDKYFMWIHYERLHYHNKAKHNKTVCIFLGIHCKSRHDNDFHSYQLDGRSSSSMCLRSRNFIFGNFQHSLTFTSTILGNKICVFTSLAFSIWTTFNAVFHLALWEHKKHYHITDYWPSKYATTCLNWARTGPMLPASAQFWPS